MSEWNVFTKRITINRPVDAIYESWATQSGIESWFLRRAEFTSNESRVRDRSEFIEAGDSYLWWWHGWGDEVNLRGEIIAANGVDRLKFWFHDPMTVSVSIFREGGVSIVELVQENIPLDEDSRKNYFVGCGEGWTFYLANLKSVLEGGLDLRNKDEKIRSVINS